jgi:hypothetical protein
VRIQNLKNSRYISLLTLPIVLTFCLNATAQFQNPIHAMKDAWKKAKQQQQQQQPQQQQQQQQPVPQQVQTTQVSSGSVGAPAQAVSFDVPSASGSFGKIADYKKMPDIVGIHLGMPAQEAYAVLRQEAGGSRIDPWPANLPYLGKIESGNQPAMHAWLVNTGGGCQPSQGQSETYDVEMTFPPNPQVVWEVIRCMFPKQPLNKGQVLASLRKKYGKETLAMDVSGGPTTDDSRIVKLYWLFDEAGQPAPPPGAGLQTLQVCFGSGFESVSASTASDVEDLENKTGKVHSMTPWCSSEAVAVVVDVESGANLTYHVYSFIYDVPLALRSLRATHDWWRATLAKLQQDEIERSKQQKAKF